MDNASAQYQIPVGTDVYASDGEKLGTVSSAGADYVVIEKGFFFPTDYYIPINAISSFDGDKVYVNVSRDVALNTSAWSAQPASGSWSTTTQTSGRANLRDEDNIVVPVHEEELVATKRQREAGEVAITKNVVEEARTIEVPITEERVQVTRRAVDREATGDSTAFQGETIEVPLTTEEVDLQKRVRVAEEIEIDREQVQTTQQVQGTVRKEVVDVNEVETDLTTRTDTDTTRRKNA